MPKLKTRSRVFMAFGMPPVLVLAFLSGCGTTRQNSATEQLLLSDAVDRSVARIDFSPLTGRNVYLDTQYIQPFKQGGLVNSDYIVSSIRQQMIAARCLLQERRDDAELIVEARVGALGADGHDVSYGIPANSTLNSAMTLVPNTPALPAIPELSLAKKTEDLGAAKIAVFAYHRESREPYWQSGISQARSTAKNRWLFGAGPFQSGSIFKDPRFAGRKINVLESTERERYQEQRDERFRGVAIWSPNVEESGENTTTDQRVEQLLAEHPKSLNDDGDSDLKLAPKRSAVRLANHEEPTPPEPPAKNSASEKSASHEPAAFEPGDEAQQLPSDPHDNPGSASESTNHTGVDSATQPSVARPPAGWLDSFHRFGARVNGLL